MSFQTEPSLKVLLISLKAGGLCLRWALSVPHGKPWSMFHAWTFM